MKKIALSKQTRGISKIMNEYQNNQYEIRSNHVMSHFIPTKISATIVTMEVVNDSLNHRILQTPTLVKGQNVDFGKCKRKQRILEQLNIISQQFVIQVHLKCLIFLPQQY